MTTEMYERTGVGRRTAIDIHPTDLTARMQLRDRLVEIRRERRLSVATAAQMVGCAHEQQLYTWEASPHGNARLDSYARWARAFGYRLELAPLGVPGYQTTPESHFFELVPGDGFQHLAVITALIAARRCTTVAAVAERMDVTLPAVTAFERAASDTTTVAAVQKYTRALGGFLQLRLEPV